MVIDQVTKLAVKGFALPFLGINYEGMYPQQSIPIFGDFFKLTFVENKGIAFGIELHPVVKVLVSLVSVVAAGMIVYYIDLIASKNRGAAVGLALILAGAIGNMIDRVFYGVLYGYAPMFYGHVVDFFHIVFDVTIFGYYIESFPIFNVADVAVSLGVAVLFIYYGKEKKEGSEEEEDGDGGAEEEVRGEEEVPGGVEMQKSTEMVRDAEIRGGVEIPGDTEATGNTEISGRKNSADSSNAPRETADGDLADIGFEKAKAREISIEGIAETGAETIGGNSKGLGDSLPGIDKGESTGIAEAGAETADGNRKGLAESLSETAGGKPAAEEPKPGNTSYGEDNIRKDI
ncbi:MAG: signal peptidase II [Ignavibacteriaceae bacterium]|nr:MAG: signal peptidase II [Ignavibacteriaceae bacterium]